MSDAPLPIPLAPRRKDDTTPVPQAALTATDELLVAFNNHDANAFASLFIPDAWFINVIGHRFTGREEIRQAHIWVFQNNLAEAELEETDVVTRMVTDDVAIIEATWKTDDHHNDPKGPSVRRGVLVFVEHKNEEGGWDIVHCTNCDYSSHPYDAPELYSGDNGSETDRH